MVSQQGLKIRKIPTQMIQEKQNNFKTRANSKMVFVIEQKVKL